MDPTERELIERFCAGPIKKSRAEVRGSVKEGNLLCARGVCTKRPWLSASQSAGRGRPAP
jgi:hypothetical protein